MPTVLLTPSLTAPPPQQQKSIASMESVMDSLCKSGSLFEVTVPDYKQLKACHKEVCLLKELWDMIVMVRRMAGTRCGRGRPAPRGPEDGAAGGRVALHRPQPSTRMSGGGGSAPPLHPSAQTRCSRYPPAARMRRRGRCRHPLSKGSAQAPGGSCNLSSQLPRLQRRVSLLSHSRDRT